LWLFVGHWRSRFQDSDTSESSEPTTASSAANSFVRTVVALAFTDLAFSIDSVAAAVAISDQMILVISGALIGVIALRFTSGLFIRWLEIFSRLESAGYLAVGFVGLKLLVGLVWSTLVVPEWFTLATVTLLMIWGFSERSLATAEES